ncbi:dihydrolipoamide acetyltransferase family protein [Microbacterium sp.]|uniref:dihydrolipoamide acetyltransferase family protein n=1 Tax=Microbacterium sp. TaxID=51671 RepID=UPI0027325A36|nr:dihydrolipoamide acetyltransferase family protein [Microbacterium sp.]MDP3951963.1 dihydrolipoamide acetyltransferase family protein [Microbacterium sp.]
MIDILMPRLSDTMTEGAIAAWHKKPGDTVKPGDILVEIETDKALMEQEAYDAGILVEILVPEGENVEIGTPIARLDDGSRPSVPPSAPAEEREQRERRTATPLVRRLAREQGIDLAHVSGTGPGGRIVRADLAPTDADIQTPASAPIVRAAETREEGGSQRVPFDAIRQAVASRLTESATTIPTFTATASADVGELLALRRRINDAHADTGVKVSVNDLLVRAVAIALRAHPAVNASYDPEGTGFTVQHDHVNVGIAVASPAGLVVPVIRDADRASVTAIAGEARTLVSKAAERKLSTGDMRDGTFTISNLGMYGVDHFTAIINPPQGAILAVGAVRDELGLVEGELTQRKLLSVTLTADHRIIDGADAARFLATLKGLLTSPLRVVS